MELFTTNKFLTMIKTKISSHIYQHLQTFCDISRRFCRNKFKKHSIKTSTDVINKQIFLQNESHSVALQ
jgi:hypothetical protein